MEEESTVTDAASAVTKPASTVTDAVSAVTAPARRGTQHGGHLARGRVLQVETVAPRRVGLVCGGEGVLVGDLHLPNTGHEFLEVATCALRSREVTVPPRSRRAACRRPPAASRLTPMTERGAVGRLDDDVTSTEGIASDAQHWELAPLQRVDRERDFDPVRLLVLTRRSLQRVSRHRVTR